MRNRFKTGDVLEVLSPDARFHNKLVTVPVMTGEDGAAVTDAKVPCARLLFGGVDLPELSMLRRPKQKQA